ncbi:response regulator transcription factor [Propionibacterium sp. NM47_B9-13]|jgi:DNA-binding NarL/FixJ family response regulator|uniref:DNA-binding response regulator n=2 Tax=Cutibacterium modestum TaxID=2559073 RepID=A0AAD1KMJ3_9ACTN|nr:response regulator transcription factor [Cutibacterium modestum]TGY28667.1 response regulator transcription factor [Propionibacterium sp. NM47_B9-13]EFS73380.1 response regulator receiver domain protein [Cutibacterium modestum HL037PA2]EFS92168.1 response regulator receiver domain protein [Cutibacterium modestum HL044PA1]EFT14365.1 response regulator receiver domain protein [Cutibacterium modestum HL037PA3]EGG27839.1 putative two component response regulator [Cutibacterium modestum P08]
MLPVRVLLVDDDTLVRKALRQILEATNDLEVVGEAGDGDEAVRHAHQADVVLMDLRMPGMGGVEATSRIIHSPSPPKVVVLTTVTADAAIIDAIHAGASGFLLKTSSPEEIVNTVRAAHAGDAFMSPTSTRQLLEQLRSDAGRRDRRAARRTLAALTDREREVAVAVAEGLTNDAIAAQLNISASTVKAHLSTIQTKLDVDSRVRIAVLVERAGYLAA